MEERDHRIIGKELDLFTFSELVGPGLPLWTPKGTVLRSELDAFVWELRARYWYEKVEIPHITKKDLYEKSGHWDKFEDDLFRITHRYTRANPGVIDNCRSVTLTPPCATVTNRVAS